MVGLLKSNFMQGAYLPDANVDVPPHVAETVQAIALLRAEHHRKSTLSERLTDQATSFVGRPRFLLLLLATVMFWSAGNAIVQIAGLTPLDPPPFGWMELVLTVSALVIAVMILTSQRRADRFANLREQMTLEATLLTEQKTRKIIELLEELRRDSPNIRDRLDLEAEQMTAKTDPREIQTAVKEDAQEIVRTLIDGP